MPDHVLYGFPEGGNSLSLYRDTDKTDFMATFFDESQVGEFVQFSDGWCCQNWRVVRVEEAR